jgi:hypothetical protein
MSPSDSTELTVQKPEASVAAVPMVVEKTRPLTQPRIEKFRGWGIALIALVRRKPRPALTVPSAEELESRILDEVVAALNPQMPAQLMLNGEILPSLQNMFPGVSDQTFHQVVDRACRDGQLQAILTSHDDGTPDALVKLASDNRAPVLVWLPQVTGLPKIVMSAADAPGAEPEATAVASLPQEPKSHDIHPDVALARQLLRAEPSGQ